MVRDADLKRGLDALRRAVADVLETSFGPQPALQPALVDHPLFSHRAGAATRPSVLMSEALVQPPTTRPAGGHDGSDSDLAVSSEADEAEGNRLIALVELARKGDTEAFGMLYDHYQGSVYRFLYYRVGSQALAEDLTSETFFRALRSMSSFRWQGKDFGAWLMTIARNLTTDHYKAGRTRLEMTTEDMSPHDSATEGPENAVLASLTNEALLEALRKLPAEQQECLIMRFLQGLSIAETAQVLGRSDGAVKQLQLRGVRNLAKLMPEGLR
jgi:RNA polymerase sigma-70 factor (ECF subfamily)